MVLESNGDKAVKMMVKLLQTLWKSGLITLDQMNRVSRVTVGHYGARGCGSVTRPLGRRCGTAVTGKEHW